MIEQSSGGEDFERAALRAVSQWKYRPATQDGAPVERALKTTIRFQVQGGGGGLLVRGEHDRASSTPKISDLAQMRRALERAVGDGEDMYLSTDQFVAAAERLVVLHAQAADIAAAIGMFERLRDTVTDRRRRRGSDRLMAMEAAVGEFDYWVHDLLRRSFSLADIDGRLESLDVRCERGRRRIDTVVVDTVWRVPDDWGACGVYIKGEPGATFAFREYPPSYAPANAVDLSSRAAR